MFSLKIKWNKTRQHFRIAVLFLAYLLGGQFVFLPRAHAEVWTAQESWNHEWESRFSNWIQNEVTCDFLQPTGLKVDCADLAYALRAVYSRQHKLPFIASNKNGKQFGHFSNQWNQLPVHENWKKDQRFCTFLADLFKDVVSTRSLHHDTYPVALIPEALCPGMLVYEDIIAAHAVVVGQISKNSPLPVTYYESFVPGYEVFSTSYKTEVHLYGPDIASHHSGIVYWNQPVYRNGEWEYIPEEKMPHFSLMQYDEQFPYRGRIGALLNRLAYQKLHDRPFNEKQFIDRTVGDLVVHFADRALRIIRSERMIDIFGMDGLPGFFNQECCTLKTDKKITQMIRRTWSRLHGFGISRASLNKEMKSYTLVISKNYPHISLKQLLEAFDSGNYSTSPYKPSLNRWGMKHDQESIPSFFSGN